MSNPWAIGVELLILFLAFVPLGDLTVQALLRLSRQTLDLTRIERSIFGFYATGGILYALAYVPIGDFQFPVVAGLLVLGVVLWVYRIGPKALTQIRPGTDHWREYLYRERNTGLALVSSTALLFWAVWIFGLESFPNTYDGSMQMYFELILLHTHHAALTLEPYAAMGVTYPQGSAVFFAGAALLNHWTVLQSPLFLPPLFVALFPLAAFSWVRRVGGALFEILGLLFVLLLCSVETWPRFLVGGSYDFLMALPLLFVSIGFVDGTRLISHWKQGVLLGVATGVTATLSLVCAEILLTSVLALIIYRLPWIRMGAVRPFLRLTLAGLVSMVFVAPSIVALLRWWSYPSHVLDPAGGPSVPFITASNQPLWVWLPSSLNPFLFRPQDVWLSPFLPLKIILSFLLVTSALTLFLLALRFIRSPFESSIRRIATHIAALGGGCAVILSAGVGVGSAFPGIDLTTNLTEVSIVLFICYGLMATLPSLWAVQTLRRNLWRRRKKVTTAHTALVIAATVLIAIPLGTGVIVTAVDAPNYLVSITGSLANVSPADVAALKWAGERLPSCSTVLVAPGSAGQFLPAYANVHVVFPLVPYPANASYTQVIDSLSHGQLDNGTLKALEVLGITEVFVTGQSNLLWLPILPLPLEHDPGNFTILFHSPGSDAYVFQFIPGTEISGCNPTGD